MSLFNPHYAGQRLLDNGFVPALGIGVPWTLHVLSLHTIWSISVPIAFVEAMAGSRSSSAWLGRIGLAVTGAVFLVGCFAVAAFWRAGESFAPSVWQMGGSALIVVGLVTLAFRLPRAYGSPVAGSAPRGWLVGLASLVATSLFKMLPFQRVEPWLYAALFAALAVAGLVVVVRWSRMRGWGEAHRLALAGGALLTYAWSGFPQEPVLPVDPFIDLVGNALFALGAVAVLAIAIRRVSARL
jgi:hypothetical protein